VSPPRTPPRAIEVVGARTHNLKEVSCAIPVGALTVVTGPSGSGKSSLAFDTVYAEGQRRFVESMSTYARQFLERMERPDVERIDHILPAIAIEQKAPARSARSTVGTSTEIHDLLRLLFASIGELVCPECSRRVRRETTESALEDLLAAWGEGARLLVLAPQALTEPERQVASWARAGYGRALDAEGRVVDFDAASVAPVAGDGRVWLLVGRHRLSSNDPELGTSLGAGFELGGGSLHVRHFETGETRRYHRGLVCGSCSRRFTDLTPAHFSFNSPRGACHECQGFGRIVGIDAGKVLPDHDRTLDERPIVPFNFPSYESAYADLWKACRKYRVRRDVPWRRLTAEERAVVWDGRGDWYGVKGLFEWLEKKRYKVHVRVFLARFRGYTVCPQCHGSRLSPEAGAVRVHGRTISELSDLPLGELARVFLELAPTRDERARAGHVLDDLSRRVGTLIEIGLPYLTLSRQIRTLSGGEAQRVQLGSAIGNTLTGTLYVLDEPTVGLHPRDTQRLLGVLRRLKEAGNAVLVVEHDVDVIRAADQVLDLGPGAGRNGGRLVFAGTPAELAATETATGLALSHIAVPAAPRGSPPPSLRRPLAGLLVQEDARPWGHRPQHLRVVNARANNLKEVTVDFPLDELVAVSGVSGSGKSSLVVDVLAAGARRALRKAAAGEEPPGPHDRIEGLGQLTDVVLVDQSPLGRSARSNPATYTKAWDELRGLLARTKAAKAAGLTKGSFSFNTVKKSKGGRCEKCQGSGIVTVDMQFLADVAVVCDECEGRRFTREVLEVRLRGKNVAQLLDTTVDEARELFEDVRGVADRLLPLSLAGLGYLRLGQPTATLSGGEAQRLKVASFLPRGAAKGRVLFVFDEPTTGLHPSDVVTLLSVLRRLLAAGHSVIAVEHNLGFLEEADHLIELGPEGGEGGGRVVFEGTPAQLLAQATHTAEALRRSAAVRTVTAGA